MNNQFTARDEDSLADYTTNVFCLTDTRGLRWKKYACPCEKSSNTANDPILLAYTTALKTDALCVWRRITEQKNEVNSQLFDCPKELVIFWYGEEPVLQDFPGPSLHVVECGCYDDGISSDTMELLFKSIYNIIEKNLSNNFIRLGKWFTQPSSGNDTSIHSSFAFRFSIFIHGETTVAAAVDISQRDAVRYLSHEDLKKTSPHVANPESKVLLAPHGLDAHLTSNSLADTDNRSVQVLEEWKKFYPSVKTSTSGSPCHEKCPGVIEVMVGDVKMLYPSSLVMVPVSNCKNPSSSCIGNVNDVPISTKLVQKVWKNIKRKEEQHIPSKQLWDLKENYFHSNCGCSSYSNTSRVRSNANSTSNPFSNTFNQQMTNGSNISQNQKLSNQSSSTHFHQRLLKKNEKTIGRCLTPSLSGRITPLIINTQKVATPAFLLTSEKMTAAGLSTDLPLAGSSSLSKSDQHLSIDSSSINVPPLCNTFLSNNSPSWKPRKSNMEPKKAEYFLVSHSFTVDKTPKLPLNILDPRDDSDLAFIKQEINQEHSENVLSPVLSDDDSLLSKSEHSSQNLKRANNSNSTSEENRKKIKSEPVENVGKRGPGRPKSRRTSSVLSPLEVTMGDDDAFLPTRRVSRRTSKLRKQDSPLLSPKSISPPLTTPQKTGPKRKNTSRNAKALITPKVEPGVFTFNTTKDIPMSPPSIYLSPTVKLSSTSLTSTKDIMPNFNDLQHMFDCEDDDGFMKKPVSTESVTVVATDDPNTHMTTSSLTTTAPGITPQDLSQMFPTPPSQDPPLQTLSPITSSHDCIIQTTGTSMALLSPEMHHPVTFSESGHADVYSDPKSPDSSDTFTLPKLQVLHAPAMYKPLVLPSANRALSSHVKYTPSWDVSHNPPVLLRRPSGNRINSVSENTDAIPHLNSVECEPVLNSSLSFTNRLSSTDSNNETSCLPVKSLRENLLLCDTSYLGTNKSPTDDQGLMHYDKTVLNSKSLNGDRLFPEDVLMCSQETVTTKLMENIPTPSTFMASNYLELFLNNINSPLSLTYLSRMILKYYPTNNCETSSKGTTVCSFHKNKLLKELQPQFQKALQISLRKSILGQVHGPLTFNKLNKLSSKLSVQSVVSTNALLFCHDGDCLSASMESMKYWQSLHLEPYAGSQNVAYIVALPESDFIVNSAKQFFKEFNSIYESLNLGKHSPIVKDIRHGLLRITQKSVQKVSSSSVDDWFSRNDTTLMQKLKVVAQFCKYHLGPYLASLTLTDTTSSAISSMLNPSNPSSPMTGGTTTSNSQNSSTTPASVYDDTPSNENKNHQPTLVIYIIDPFHSDPLEGESPKLWSYTGLMKCFVEMSSHFDKLKHNIILQIIPLEQILQTNLLSRSNVTNGNQNTELRNLALSIYSRCHSNPVSWMKPTDKCMTGFGMCNSRDNVTRRRQVENNLPQSIYMPPYILAEAFSYLTNSNTHGSSYAETALAHKESDQNILFCCYCLSFDDQWLIVVCTDKLGELYESNIIKLTYPKRKKNKSLIWTVALRKLWEFITNVVSYTVLSWRVVLSKIGKFGRSELKELHNLIQKQINTLIPSNHGARPISPLSEVCGPCSYDVRRKGQCIFKSISLCTIQSNTEIQFVPVNIPHHSSTSNSCIFVSPPPKCSNATKTSSNLNNSLELMDNINLLNNSFDDDIDRDNLNNLLPILPSPSDSSIFQTSPPTDIAKMLSPPYSLHNSMPALSPFQPISNKPIYMGSPVKHQSVNKQENNVEMLAVGHLLSGSSVTEGLNHQPSIIKSELYIHMTSANQAGANLNPLNATNHLEVLKCILEYFDALSSLNVNPSTGKRTSCLPVHANNVTIVQRLLADLSS